MKLVWFSLCCFNSSSFFYSRPDVVAKAFLQLVNDDSCNGHALTVTLQNGIDFHSFLEVSDLVDN
jgi:hypothetical protein